MGTKCTPPLQGDPRKLGRIDIVMGSTSTAQPLFAESAESVTAESAYQKIGCSGSAAESAKTAESKVCRNPHKNREIWHRCGVVSAKPGVVAESSLQL